MKYLLLFFFPLLGGVLSMIDPRFVLKSEQDVGKYCCEPNQLEGEAVAFKMMGGGRGGHHPHHHGHHHHGHHHHGHHNGSESYESAESFESDSEEKLGKGGAGMAFIEFHRDFTGKRFAMSERAISRHSLGFSVILNGQNLYMIAPEKKKCYSKKIKKPMRQPCVNSNLTTVVDFSMGLAPAALSSRSYSGSKMHRGMYISGSESVTKVGCAPLSKGIFAKKGSRAFFGSVSFINLHSGIANPKVFTPPSYCKKPTGEAIEEEMGDFMYYFYHEYI